MHLFLSNLAAKPWRSLAPYYSLYCVCFFFFVAYSTVHGDEQCRNPRQSPLSKSVAPLHRGRRHRRSTPPPCRINTAFNCDSSETPPMSQESEIHRCQAVSWWFPPWFLCYKLRNHLVINRFVVLVGNLQFIFIGWLSDLLSLSSLANLKRIICFFRRKQLWSFVSIMSKTCQVCFVPEYFMIHFGTLRRWGSIP